MIGAGLVQIAQVGPTNYEVRYTRRDWNVPRDEAGFVRRFREFYFEDADLTFVEMAETPLSSSGKFLSNIVLWNPGAAATS